MQYCIVMRELQVVEVEWPLADGQEVLYLHEELPDGTLLVEPAITHGRGPDEELVDVRMLSGGMLEGATEDNSGPRVLREVDPGDPDAMTALCFERTGTVVTASIVLGDNDLDRATATVTDALSALDGEVHVRSTAVAIDRYQHVLDSDGRLIASDQPHWIARTFINSYTFAAQRPAHEVVHEIASGRAHRAEGLRREIGQRAAATRRARGSHRGGRRPALTNEEQAKLYDEDLSRAQTRKALAARWQISVPTLTKYLRAEQQRRDQQAGTRGA